MSRPFPTSASSRGTYNSRSRGRGGYASRGRPRVPETAQDNTVFLQGLKESPLESIPVVQLSGSSNKDLIISDSKYLGSYSWTKRPTPTILVPGSPAEWQDRKSFRVSPDTGTNIIDHNGHHLKEAPMLPLFAAVDANEDADTFDWPAVDIVTDRNALRHLLRWISGNQIKSFRVDLQLAGKKTVLMARWEKQSTEEYPGYTYGSNYFGATTKKTRPESVAHHRIIGYNWNGLSMVVRCTVDAFLPSDNSSKAESDLDDIVNAISSLSVSGGTMKAPEKVGDGSKLEVIRCGAKVPQQSIVEVATISQHRESQLNWEEKGPQLFLSQISHFYVGLHDRGFFTDVRKQKFDYTTLAADIKDNLKKLRRVLSTIQSIVVKHGQRRSLSIVCIDGNLRVYERVGEKSCLADKYLERFGL